MLFGFVSRSKWNFTVIYCKISLKSVYFLRVSWKKKTSIFTKFHIYNVSKFKIQTQIWNNNIWQIFLKYSKTFLEMLFICLYTYHITYYSLHNNKYILETPGNSVKIFRIVKCTVVMSAGCPGDHCPRLQRTDKAVSQLHA